MKKFAAFITTTKIATAPQPQGAKPPKDCLDQVEVETKLEPLFDKDAYGRLFWTYEELTVAWKKWLDREIRSKQLDNWKAEICKDGRSCILTRKDWRWYGCEERIEIQLEMYDIEAV